MVPSIETQSNPPSQRSLLESEVSFTDTEDYIVNGKTSMNENTSNTIIRRWIPYMFILGYHIISYIFDMVVIFYADIHTSEKMRLISSLLYVYSYETIGLVAAIQAISHSMYILTPIYGNEQLLENTLFLFLCYVPLYILLSLISSETITLILGASATNNTLVPVSDYISISGWGAVLHSLAILSIYYFLSINKGFLCVVTSFLGIVIKLIFNIIFFAFDMNMFGLALSSNISYFFVSLIGSMYWTRYKTNPVTFTNLLIEWRLMREIIWYGFPTYLKSISNTTFSLINYSLFHILTSSYSSNDQLQIGCCYVIIHLLYEFLQIPSNAIIQCMSPPFLEYIWREEYSCFKKYAETLYYNSTIISLFLTIPVFIARKAISNAYSTGIFFEFLDQGMMYIAVVIPFTTSTTLLITILNSSHNVDYSSYLIACQFLLLYLITPYLIYFPFNFHVIFSYFLYAEAFSAIFAHIALYNLIFSDNSEDSSEESNDITQLGIFKRSKYYKIEKNYKEKISRYKHDLISIKASSISNAEKEDYKRYIEQVMEEDRIEYEHDIAIYKVSMFDWNIKDYFKNLAPQ